MYVLRYQCILRWHSLCVLVLCAKVNMMFVMLLWVCIHTGSWKSLPDRGGNRTRHLWDTSPMLCQLSYEVNWQTFQLARCGCTLRVTSQTWYSPECLTPTHTKNQSVNINLLVSKLIYTVIFNKFSCHLCCPNWCRISVSCVRIYCEHLTKKENPTYTDTLPTFLQEEIGTQVFFAQVDIWRPSGYQSSARCVVSL